MIHKWMEQWFDTFLFFALLIGMLFGFLCFWRNEIQIRYAEVIVQNFLKEVSVRGKITQESLEVLVSNLGNVNQNYSIMVEGTKYVTEPVYAQIPREYLLKYFTERNNIQPVIIQEYQWNVSEESAEELRLQKETNETILAAESTEWLPLPGEETGWEVEAVRPVQEVYEKESLITLCRITSETGSYYAEAAPILAEQSGVVYLELILGENSYQIPVEILCYPRTVECKYGHELVNTEQVLREFNLTGEVKCPYCREIPRQITVDSPIVLKKCGSKLNSAEVSLLIEYMDSHIEIITSDSDEWQDSFDENYCGIQQVKISCKGETLYITVVSENEKCKQCGGDCNERCYTDYLRFPYCLTCLEKQAVFTCEFYKAEQKISRNEIFLELAEKQEVCFLAGDFVTVRLMKRDKFLSLLQEKVRQDGKVHTE